MGIVEDSSGPHTTASSPSFLTRDTEGKEVEQGVLQKLFILQYIVMDLPAPPFAFLS
tara:strand:- start:887 stop:1057 length:171 start_codon:yes stop_codon:yes gene_type:complete